MPFVKVVAVMLLIDTIIDASETLDHVNLPMSTTLPLLIVVNTESERVKTILIVDPLVTLRAPTPNTAVAEVI